MIKKRSYSIEWLDSKVKEYEANSYDLAEKMVYAFTLLEHLKLKGLDFIFKGGTSLILMLDEFHRFSKDIDIIIEKKPDNLTEIFNSIVEDSPFIRWEPSERKNDEFQVPKDHYKFIYQQSKPSKYPEQPIMLDIIFIENTYPETQSLNISNPFLDTEQPITQVITPTLDSIAGDKLTAFAPATIGIPLGKNKAVEIVKQLFDLNILFEKITNLKIVGQSFEKTALMCIKSYKKDFTVEQVYQDIFHTSFVMAMMGKHDKDLFNEIKSGVTALNQYLSKKTRFGYNKAITAAAKISYFTSCLMIEIEPEKLDWKSVPSEELKKIKIDHSDYRSLNKALKAGYPEAWYYWLHTTIILNKKEENKVKESHINLISLAFIVNGKEIIIEKVNIHQPLKVAVEKALEKTGNSGRPLTDWLVKWDDRDLDISKKIEEFHFTKDAKIFISLKSGVGGKK